MRKKKFFSVALIVFHTNRFPHESKVFCLQLLGAVGAVNLLCVDNETLVGEGQGAFLAGEAILVPGESLVVHHVGAMAEPWRADVGLHQRQLTEKINTNVALYPEINTFGLGSLD